MYLLLHKNILLYGSSPNQEKIKMESVIFAVFVVVVVCFIPDVSTDATFGLELGKIRF